MWGERQENSDTEKWLAWWREHGERELCCILMTAWDPIGVGDAPQAWGEYEDYALPVARILRETIDPEESASRIADYLNGVVRDSMKLDSDRLANDRLAGSLVAWHEWSYTRAGSPLAAED